MEKSKIKKRKIHNNVMISIRIPKTASDFMKKNEYSPTAIFVEALKELGWKK